MELMIMESVSQQMWLLLMRLLHLRLLSFTPLALELIYTWLLAEESSPLACP